ncbi:hypothetical protein [Adhaeretor mobilis]|uniref:Uncharacterized protein n=1 Tax=Adhaeretor mobilis TaxID=1930276 RepID=A0A517MR28_9BACT|nr:hypothetical protein [Adhaeretor mobilis]QDS97342.1 hypothetical protein HG15A2_06030 [Adhaeretor mobilis]
MNWVETLRIATHALVAGARRQTSLLAEDLPLLADFSQMNRRTRRAMRTGRGVRATYLYIEHQRRRLARRREIRELVGH